MTTNRGQSEPRRPAALVPAGLAHVTGWRRAALLGLLSGLVLVTAAPAKPTVEKTATAWTVSNATLRLTFDLTAGGWLTRVVGADGRVWVEGGYGYTDFGLFEGRRHISSRFEPAPQVTLRETADAVTVTATGRMRPGPTDSLPAEGLGYELAVTVDDSPEVQVSCGWRSAPARPAAKGFLAAIWTLPGITEWYADTIDGRVNELIHTDRCYQSSELPLDPARSRLGIVYRDGRRLEVLDARPTRGPLENLFLLGGERASTLFVATLSGATSADWAAGERWSTQMTWNLSAAPARG